MRMAVWLKPILKIVITVYLAGSIYCTEVSKPENDSAAVSGKLLDESGAPAAGATVVMRSRVYVPADGFSGMNSDCNVYTTLTDKNGGYSFGKTDSVKDGNYCIEAFDPLTKKCIFIDNITICRDDNPLVVIASPLVETDGVLRKPGSIRGTVPSTKVFSPFSISVLGLDRHAESSSDGSFIIDDVPHGKCRLQFNYWNNTMIRTTTDIEVRAEETSYVFRIAYYGNGNTSGNVPVDYSWYSKGDLAEIMSNAGNLKRTGYTFTGWNMESSGTAPAYPTGEKLTIEVGPNSLLLYAAWALKKCKLIFDKNDSAAVGAMEPLEILYEASADIPETDFTKDEYNFIGWATRSDGAVVFTTRAKYAMMSEDDTVYARWFPKKVTMVLIPAGDSTFTMGGRYDDAPVHSVTFASDFLMDSTEVTQAQYRNVMSIYYDTFNTLYLNCNFNKGDDYPVYFINWNDAFLYCNALTKLMGSADTVYRYAGRTFTGNRAGAVLAGIQVDLSKNGYRLPTEAQWEYAYRGGTTTDFYWGKNYEPTQLSEFHVPYPSTPVDFDEVMSYAVTSEMSGSGPHPVASKKKNAFGLYDMAGNVWDLCNDWYAPYDTNPQVDPIGPSSGSSRVCRGGASWEGPSSAVAFCRGNWQPDIICSEHGFRVCIPVH